MEPLWLLREPQNGSLGELLREPRELYVWMAPLAPSKAPLVFCVNKYAIWAYYPKWTASIALTASTIMGLLTHFLTEWKTLITSPVSGRGNRIVPVCLSVCVCLVLWELHCVPPRGYMSMCLSHGDCLSAQRDFLLKRIVDYGRRRCVNAGAFSLDFTHRIKSTQPVLG